ncbi:MAG: hypothetical protein NZ903_02205 [Candidatus Micrarchaeota archaeon]|nr:hypothetical protein [Candidatus Micrarchaeota archaeon]
MMKGAENNKNLNFDPNSLICDSSSLISLTDAGLLGALIMLKKDIKGKFLITEEIINESVNVPIQKPEYAFSAVRIKRAIESGVFTIARYEKSTLDEILRITNNMFYTDRPFHLVNHGEAEIIAAALDNNVKYLLMDERTTRMLIESPIELRKHIENEFRTRININEALFREFREMTQDIKVIRSSELLALAKAKGYFKKFGYLEQEAYKAALYALKFNGCSISFEEIDELSKLV